MARSQFTAWIVGCWTVGLFLSWGVAHASTPTASEALQLTPTQEVEYDRPTAEEAARCRIRAERMNGGVGWVVENAAGTILRRFVDTNGDNIVDQWSYFKEGVEVYRDIDSNYDGEANEFRWFNTAGTRWGIDRTGNGKIDTWKAISPEELSAEVVAALAQRDADRFAPLTLKAAELAELGLGEAMAEQLGERISNLAARFVEAAAQQQSVGRASRWLQLSVSRPGTVPSGTDGSTKDVHVYENATALVDTEGTSSQIFLGTLVRVGEGWRIIDLPQVDVDGEALAAASTFFQPAAAAGAAAGDGLAEATQKLLSELEALDRSMASAEDSREMARLAARRADLLEQLAEGAGASDERAMWLRQLADMVSGAVLMGDYPEGVDRLAALYERLRARPEDRDLAAYVRFREMTAEFVLRQSEPKPDYAQIQEDWLTSLEDFVDAYPKSPDASEAMLQLAMTKEFADEEDEALNWYRQIVKNFPESAEAAKAAGAQRRLESEGKPITVRGPGVSGETVDLARLRGRVVLIHYWATWSEPSRAVLPTLRELVNKYGNAGFSIIGVSLDHDAKDLSTFLGQNRLPWPQIFEEGGLDSRPANEMGIFTIPTMVLVDKQGRVIHRNIRAPELEAAIKEALE